MAANITEKPEADPQRTIATKPRVSFKMVLAGLALLACLAGAVFWATCIRQPGVSYPGDSATTASESQAQQQEPVPDRPASDSPKPPIKDDPGLAFVTPQAALQKQLTQYVEHLANSIGERNLKNIKQLNAAADYVEAQLSSFGYQPRRQTYDVRGFDCHNIDVEIVGSKVPEEIVIIGAHYDSAVGTPGANDNGSGTAAMLALAQRFARARPERTLRFVGWTNEEPPYFQTRGQMGSMVYAAACRQRDEDIKAVLSLETMGYFTDAENSQKYPPPLNLLYPTTGNFIGFVANIDSRSLQRRVIKTFRENAIIASEGAALPATLPGIGWSDHWSFWQEGYAGVMVTDTAPFRYPHYHRATDTPDKVNFPEMTKVVLGLEIVIHDLVQAP